MPSIRITSFGGINTEIAPRLAQNEVAQVAHNCLLWDGTLRPLAKWIKQQGVDFATVASMAISQDDTVRTAPYKESIFLSGEKYILDTKLGLEQNLSSFVDSNIIYTNPRVAGFKYVGLHTPPVNTSSGISYDRGYHSDKPVNRMYAVSGVRKVGNAIEESTLALIPNQSPQSVIYEGDNATIAVNVTALVPYEYTGLRLYRSISGMDTGIDTTNELDTEWYLVAELNGTPDGILYNYVYIDGGSATTAPLDAYLAKDFYPPRRYLYKYLQQTESGWFVAASADGKIVVSERYLYHAWPIENFYNIADVEITGMKCQFDTVYIGTNDVPCIMAIASGEKLGVQVGITPFPESYPCLAGSMVKSASGAIYASPSGIVSLAREGMQRVTAGVASGVNPLYKIEHRWDTVALGVTTHHVAYYPMRFEHTTHGAYLRGEYFGFCKINTNLTVLVEGFQEPLFLFKGYIFNTGSTLDGSRALQRLVTCDTPPDVRAHAIGRKGLYILALDGVYSMPFPDTPGLEVYANAPKYCYEWKSKKFVFPGQMVMAAAKVVHNCKGFVRLKIMVDCCCVYEVLVHDCQPFTLPPNMAGVEWEVELVGTAAVSEVHLASSLRELIEHESS